MLIGFGYYMLLAGQIGVEQIVSAAILTFIALCWSAVLRRRGSERVLRPDLRHLAPWLRAAARIPADTVRIGAMLIRVVSGGGSYGRAVEQPFAFGPKDEPEAAARRATAVLAGSLTPDTFVVDVMPGHTRARCHRLLATPSSDDREWLA